MITNQSYPSSRQHGRLVVDTFTSISVINRVNLNQHERFAIRQQVLLMFTSANESTSFNIDILMLTSA